MQVGHAVAALWLFWLVSWILAASWADPVRKRADFRAEARYRVLWLAGTVLLFVPAHGYVGRLRLWTPTLTQAWICVALIAIGIACAWWARLHLGRLWSSTVTAKADHRIIDTGPYARLSVIRSIPACCFRSSPPWPSRARYGASRAPPCCLSGSSSRRGWRKVSCAASLGPPMTITRAACRCSFPFRRPEAASASYSIRSSAPPIEYPAPKAQISPKSPAFMSAWFSDSATMAPAPAVLPRRSSTMGARS